MYELPLKRGYRRSDANSSTGEDIMALTKSGNTLLLYGLRAHVAPRGNRTLKAGHQAEYIE